MPALKRRFFFAAAEKKVLLVNSYAVWLFSWLAINVAVAKRSLWGLEYYSIDVPRPVLAAAGAAMAATSAATLVMLWLRHKRGLKAPLNGLVAYGASLYMWLLLVRLDPLWFLVVPVLHSLQYLVVVWRFEANYQRGEALRRPTLPLPLLERLFGSADRVRVAGFVAAGWILGFVGLWGLPIVLDAVVPLRQGRVRRHDVPVHRVDLHQRPPLPLGQRHVAPATIPTPTATCSPDRMPGGAATFGAPGRLQERRHAAQDRRLGRRGIPAAGSSAALCGRRPQGGAGHESGDRRPGEDDQQDAQRLQGHDEGGVGPAIERDDGDRIDPRPDWWPGTP